MPTWVWILIAVGVVLLVAIVVSSLLKKRRTSQLQGQFGPEYDRTVESADSKRNAEKELAERRDRREQIDVRPLRPAARERYTEQWQTIQAQFVDSPQAAVTAADHLIQSVMEERGYPVDDFDTRAADISVDHPHVVENYREGHRLAERNADGNGSTEDLRQAMRHYRSLFEELVGADADQPLTRDDGAATSQDAARQRVQGSRPER